MGEPKFSRRKYARPIAPWEAERIKNENEVLKKYGLKNKKELWRTQMQLSSFREQSKDLQARLRFKDPQAQKETEALIRRLQSLSILPAESNTLDDVLGLNVEMILNRRLQTLVYLKGLAATPSQARQLIIHGHTFVNGRKVTVPGYMVRATEEATIEYNPRSPLTNDMHPARPRRDEAGNLVGGAPQPVKAEATPAEAPADGTASVQGGEPAKPVAEPAEKTEKASK